VENDLRNTYDLKFYGDAKVRIDSALIVLKTFFDYYRASSLLDVGCGLGHWLYVAKNHFNPQKILGIDGNYVNENELLISREEFLRHDLETPLSMNDTFDLCISIETAEHISPENASQFVNILTNSADVILFSAAPPYQDGIHHVNENTPAYWAEKFREKGFVCFDFMRDLLWEDEVVNCIYPQNLLVFANASKKSLFEDKGLTVTENPILKYHPRFVELKLKARQSGNCPKPKHPNSLYRHLIRLASALIPSKQRRKKFRAALLK
jgi:SAM-dependent methyltransferase